MRRAFRSRLSWFIAAAVVAVTLAAEPAEARHRHRWWRGAIGAAVVGAVVADLVVDASIRVHTPPVSIEVHTHPHYRHYPPPPPVVMAPPPVVVAPAPVIVTPAPVVASHAPPAMDARYPTVGLALFGALDTGHAESLPVGGLAGALQLRTSSHSLLSIELQSLGARTSQGEIRRSELAGLLSGRIFFWDHALAPYLELGAGFGRASLRTTALEVEASQLLGRAGLGLELRLGPHIVLDAGLAQVHRLRLDDDGPSTLPTGLGWQDRHERATELRAGMAVRF